MHPGTTKDCLTAVLTFIEELLIYRLYGRILFALMHHRSQTVSPRICIIDFKHASAIVSNRRFLGN